MADVHVMGESAQRPAGDDGPGKSSQYRGAPDEQRICGGQDLYARARAACDQSRLLAGQLQAAQRTAGDTWQLIRDAWDRAEQIRAQWLAARAQPGRLRYSAHARLQARLASMPVIEQAKGILMAQYGWPEEQAFDALRRASQRENIKVRELAARIVAQTVRSAPARRRAGRAAAPAAELGRPGLSGSVASVSAGKIS